ncbi:ASCH domain-containing protein [Citrobacter freundii]|uniref:hypothetical protein n=1 Tax=Citrobacter freundii TaxID=546 RepID=UPI00372D6C51
MKERGMIFNGEMVRAILDGRKTQTRRIMKVQPSDGFHPTHNGYDLDLNAHWYTPGVVDKNGYLQPAKKDVFGVADENEGYTCPFGAVGDRIWVRETWARYNIDQDSHDMAYRATPPADWPEEGRWRPSIHMPRWASRLMLEITGVRVERLNAISQADAIAEGAPPSHPSIDCVSREYGFPDFSRSWFGQTWQHIYGEESWQANPWVWVIEFKVVPNVQDNPA